MLAWLTLHAGNPGAANQTHAHPHAKHTQRQVTVRAVKSHAAHPQQRSSTKHILIHYSTVLLSSTHSLTARHTRHLQDTKKNSLCRGKTSAAVIGTLRNTTGDSRDWSSGAMLLLSTATPSNYGLPVWKRGSNCLEAPKRYK